MKNANLIFLVALLSISCGAKHSKSFSPREPNNGASKDIQVTKDSRNGNKALAETQLMQQSNLSSPPESVRATNEHIQFLADAQKGKTSYSQAQLRRWRTTTEPPEIPESADFHKLEHARLFLAANPHRYESFVVYGLHFFLRQKFDVAVAAYDEAVSIIQKEGIKDTVEYAKFYDMSLIKLYGQQREYDKALALATFEKLVRFDFEFFNREPELAKAIYLAALDYYDIGRPKEAKRLMAHTRKLKAVPVDVRKQLEWLYKKIEVEQVYSSRRQ